MNTFHLHIVTPHSDFYSGEAEYLCVDTPDGKMGILPHASCRIVALAEGSIVIKTSVVETDIRCGKGIMVVGEDGVTILCENCFSDEQEDRKTDRAQSEYNTAKARIAISLKNMKEKSDGGV